MLKLLISSDHKAFRESLTRLLLSQPFIKIIGVCADTHAAVNITAAELPDVVLVDGSSDPLAAIEATKKIRSCSAASVIAMSAGMDADFAGHMLAAGALGYLTSLASTQEIVTAVQEVAKDNVYLCNAYCPQQKSLPVQTPVALPSRKATTSQPLPAQNNGSRFFSHWHSILHFAN